MVSNSYGSGTGLASYYAGTLDGKSKPVSNTSKPKKKRKCKKKGK